MMRDPAWFGLFALCLRHYVLQASHCPESLPHSWVCIQGRNYRKAREVWQRPKQATVWIGEALATG